jgi:hypothetical protein
MVLQDLDELIDPVLRLPIHGKTYEVRSPSAELGIKLERLFQSAIAQSAGVSASDISDIKLSDDEERNLYKQLLGPVWDEMVVDDLPWVYVKHVGVTALLWVAGGLDAAEAYWSTAPGEAKRPEPQDHKAPANKKTTRTRSTSSAQRVNVAGSDAPKDSESPVTT